MGLPLEDKIFHILKIMKSDDGVNMNIFAHFGFDIGHFITSLLIVTYY